MTDADRIIAALHTVADELDPHVRALTPEQRDTPTAPGQWTPAQVLSHLGSGAVITLAGLEAALAGERNPGGEANQAVWAVWDAKSPQQMADDYLVADAALLARYDGLDAATRESLRVDLGFLPEPVDLATAARFRLNEAALHGWDVRVAIDPAAVVDRDVAALLLDQTAMMLGWISKPAALDGVTATLAVTLSDPERSLGLALGEQVALVDASDVPDAPDGTVTAPTEAWLRLLTGRLSPEHTPAGVEVTGPVGLDTLRRVFAGF